MKSNNKEFDTDDDESESMKSAPNIFKKLKMKTMKTNML